MDFCRNFSISATSSQQLHDYDSIVVDLLLSDFHMKLKLSHDKDTNFTTNEQHVRSHSYGNQALVKISL